MGQRPALVVIAAVARNGVIGNGNELPWRLPEDMQFFKQETTGHPVIMGRKTWESLPARFKPLPGRRNVVLTRDAGYTAPAAECTGSLEDALTLLAGAPKIFVIGGAEIYAQALPLARELVLTEIDCDFAGRTVFPTWPRAEFAIVEQTDHDSDQGFGYRRVRYRRKTAD